MGGKSGKVTFDPRKDKGLFSELFRRNVKFKMTMTDFRMKVVNLKYLTIECVFNLLFFFFLLISRHTYIRGKTLATHLNAQ